MELDKRIIKGKKPLTAFDVMESKFIGTDCYFSDKATDYGNLSNCQVGTLLSRDGMTGVFNATKNNSYANFDYCLPCEWVKKEPKYRPFSLAEWIEQHEIGEVITFRNRQGQVFHVMYTGYVVEKGEDIQDIRTTGRIMLINIGYFLENLFKDYEICINGEWHPFGVKE